MPILNFSKIMLLWVGLSIVSLAQERPSASLTPGPPSWIPRATLFAGPSLLGNGYQNIAESFGGGGMLNSRKLLGDFEARYMNARKTNDNTVNNRKGHERFLEGRLFYRVRGRLYVGGGAQWSETSKTNYTKRAWRPTFGGGGDHFADAWSCRWQLIYILPGTDWQNAVQGPEFQFWMPSPTSKSHFFFRQTVGIYEFHTTITDQKLAARLPTDRGGNNLRGLCRRMAILMTNIGDR